MENINSLGVFYHEKKVGTLALYKKYLVAFQYDSKWLAEGFSVSPFSLPLDQRVFFPRIDPFDGLFGVFADSLPDGWGHLLADRMLRKNGIDPCSVGILNRLSIVGDTGMGALTYKPEYMTQNPEGLSELDLLAQECGRILNEENSGNLDELFYLGGSSGGAIPKILTKIDNEDWIIKFPSSSDDADAGLMEYEYSVCAQQCGIEMEETALFPSRICSGYFGTRRFDRIKNASGTECSRVHMISVAALLETSHRIPNLDYDILMKLTLKLTKDFQEVEKLFRLMCFNVFAHNRDDHSKNFTFLYKEEEKRWVLSPAYDLTYSNSLGGEHATTIHGEGKCPEKEDILNTARAAGLNLRKAERTADEIRECVYEMLGKYL